MGLRRIWVVNPDTIYKRITRERTSAHKLGRWWKFFAFEVAQGGAGCRAEANTAVAAPAGTALTDHPEPRLSTVEPATASSSRMNVFDLRQRLVSDYARYTKSFI